MKSLALSLAVVLCASSTTNAQSDELLPYLFRSSPPGAMRYRMFEVLRVAPVRELELSPDQKDALDELSIEYGKRLREIQGERHERIDELAVAGGGSVNLKDLAKLESPGMKVLTSSLEDEIEQRAKSVLLPHQLVLAENTVLRGRLKRYGLAGLLNSEELARLELTRSADEIAVVVSERQAEVNGEMAALMKEYQEMQAKFKKQILDLKRQQLTKALIDLGADGEKLQQLLDTLSE